MSSIEQYGLPVDTDCETFVLGAVLRDAATYYPQVADVVDTDDFSVAKHRTLWATIRRLRDNGTTPDRVTVYKDIATFGQEAIDEIGGLAYLMGLDELIPPVPNVSEYAARVREKATLRKAIQVCQSTIDRLCQPTASTGDVIEAQRVISRLADAAQPQRRFTSIGEVIQPGESAKAFLAPEIAETGIQWPWPTLNRVTGGLRPGNVVIVAARPGDGKTTAATQIAAHSAKNGVGVVMASLEMSQLDMARKVVSAEAGVPMTDWINGHLQTRERQQIAGAALRCRTLPLWFDESPRATVPGLHAALLRHRAENEVGLVVVDYLQLMTPAGKGSTRTEDVSEMTRGLKVMAMELQLPVIVLSQLSRGSAKEQRRPRLDDLRESGSIEQDADMVLFLYPKEKPWVEFILAKQRMGGKCAVDMLFNAPIGTFTEQETE